MAVKHKRSIITRIATAILGVGLLFVYGAFFTTKPDHLNVSKVTQSVVKLSDDEGHGSGVIVGPHTILSAAHVVGDGSHKMTATTADGQTFEATPTWLYSDGDLALLTVKVDLPATPLPISCAPLRQGDEVVSIGYPLGLELVANWGRVSSDHLLKNLVPVDLSLAPGNSGGPIFNTSGEVVGLADAVALAPIGFFPSITGDGLIVPMTSLCSTLPSFVVSK